MSHTDYCAQFVKSGDKILDIGSGRGKFLLEMSKRGFHVAGIETSLQYIQEALTNLNKAGFSAQIINGRGEELPFADNYFNFINCSEVTEHVDDPNMVLGEIRRVLKPGGRGYISFHNRYGIYDYHYHMYFINWLPRKYAESLLKFLGKQKKDGDIGHQKLITMHYFTYRQAVEIMKTNDFEIKDIRTDKIKLKFGSLSPLFLIVYIFILRPFYFNTFHFLLKKSE